MVIRLLPVQIPGYWEIIKYIATKADEIDEKDLSPYLNELLNALLNEKAQCWVSIDADRILERIAITRIALDKITQQRYCLIQCLYSFIMINEDELKDSFDMLKRYAENEKCSYVSFETRNAKVAGFGAILGFKERFTNYRMEIGG